MNDLSKRELMAAAVVSGLLGNGYKPFPDYSVLSQSEQIARGAVKIADSVLNEIAAKESEAQKMFDILQRLVQWDRADQGSNNNMDANFRSIVAEAREIVQKS